MHITKEGDRYLRTMLVQGALDGFYKHPDGTVTAMPDEEFYEFD
jgi:hypothetical protein